MDPIIQDLLNRFKKDQELANLRDDALFEAFAAYCVIGGLYDHEFDPDAVRMGASADLGIDAAAIFINGTLYTEPDAVKKVVSQNKAIRVHFVVVQAKLTGPFRAQVFTDIADNLVHLFTNTSIQYRANARVQEFHECIRAIYDNVGRLADGLPQLSVWYVTPGTADEAVLAARRKAARERIQNSQLFSEVGLHAAGSRELSELYRQSAEAVSASFVMTRRMTIPEIPGVRQAYVGLLSATDLVKHLLSDPLGHIRTAIFNDNVRDFLGYGAVDKNGKYSSVNAAIRNTLQDSVARNRFAVLNNGVTIVARRVVTAGDRFELRDFQVVNGCQTCYVLFDRAKAADLGDGVFVNVRVVESEDDDVISAIVEATNRQNTVTGDDLKAREEFHKRLERFFVAQPEARRLYYERRRGQYEQDALEKTKIISQAHLTMTYAAMFLGEPHRATRLRQIWDERGGELFRESDNLLAYYVSALTYYRTEWLFRNRLVSTYLPAKYHLLAGILPALTGSDRLPRASKPATRALNLIVDAMCDPVVSERTVRHLISLIGPSLEAVGSTLPELRAQVRTERFAASFRSEILKHRPVNNNR